MSSYWLSRGTCDNVGTVRSNTQQQQQQQQIRHQQYNDVEQQHSDTWQYRECVFESAYVCEEGMLSMSCMEAANDMCVYMSCNKSAARSCCCLLYMC
jgi:hypothetical protein